MLFKHILCVAKTTGYETCSVLHAQLPDFKRRQLLVEHISHHRALEKTKQECQKYGLDVTFLFDKDLSENLCGKYDLILTLGGDGTFLTVAQYCTNTPILGINSHPVTNGSRGALLGARVTSLSSILNAIKKGTLHFERWARLSTTLDGKVLNSTAVNEIFFGPAEQDKTIEFLIKTRGESQVVLSSGTIISTPQGSTGWYANAGGRPFEKKFGIGVLVREPNPTRLLKFKEKKVSSSSRVSIEWGGQEAFISFDSRREARYYCDAKKHVLKIQLSQKRGLWVVRI